MISLPLWLVITIGVVVLLVIGVLLLFAIAAGKLAMGFIDAFTRR
jgi:hypothetical protein